MHAGLGVPWPLHIASRAVGGMDNLALLAGVRRGRGSAAAAEVVAVVAGLGLAAENKGLRRGRPRHSNGLWRGFGGSEGRRGGGLTLLLLWRGPALYIFAPAQVEPLIQPTESSPLRARLFLLTIMAKNQKVTKFKVCVNISQFTCSDHVMPVYPHQSVRVHASPRAAVRLIIVRMG